MSANHQQTAPAVAWWVSALGNRFIRIQIDAFARALAQVVDAQIDERGPSWGDLTSPIILHTTHFPLGILRAAAKGAELSMLSQFWPQEAMMLIYRARIEVKTGELPLARIWPPA